MGKGNYSDKFKRDAVAQITERGYPVAEVACRSRTNLSRRLPKPPPAPQSQIRSGFLA